MQSPAHSESRGQYRRILVLIGVLWLLLAAFLFFNRQLVPPQVEITWETATEQGTAGFNLYRTGADADDFVLVNEGDFIESAGSAVSGASYAYVDTNVMPGATYRYVLEEIETDGSRQRYEDDVFEYSVPGAPWYLTLLILICLGAGAAMIWMGLKEGRK